MRNTMNGFRLGLLVPTTFSRRSALCGLVFVCAIALAAQPVAAAPWAVKMFEVTNHDFGSVARGSKAEARFKLKNIYEEPVHVAGVRSSCGCTSPTIIKPDLKTYETGEIVAELNTRDFLGQKNATITVTFDKPFPAEVQLQVSGFIRSDVVLTPGLVDFGAVDAGIPLEKKLAISFAGREDWQIVDVKSANSHLEAELSETSRGRGRVGYELVVRLSKDTPPGYLNENLILVSNDSTAMEMPVEVRGQVLSQITVSPESLFMGTVTPGSQVIKQLVVRGKKPFKITAIECSDARFELKPSEDSKTLHLIPVTFTAGNTAGKVTQKIVIETDQGEGGKATFTAYAQIQ